MPTHFTTVLEWTITFTPLGTIGSPLVFESGGWQPIRPSAWKLEQRSDAAATTLEIVFPSADQFASAWNLRNPFSPGSEVVLDVEGLPRFTGWVHEHIWNYNANTPNVSIICKDRMAMMMDAVVDIDMIRDIFRSGRDPLTRSTTEDDHLFEAFTIEATPENIRPWHSDYIVPVWWWDQPNNRWYRIPLSEYQIVYDRGGIFFRNDPIKMIGGLEKTLAQVEDSIWADFVYFDETDDSTMISNILREAFETLEAIGGLGWTEGVEYEIDDETTADILSGMKWNTNLGDADAQGFLQHLYDDPKIGLVESYWIRDFNGNGRVTARLVTQEPDEKIDIDVIYDTEYQTPMQNIYTRAVLVNTEATRELLTRDSAMFTDIFEAPGYTETKGNPDDPVDLGIGYLDDDTIQTSWGYFAIADAGVWGLDLNLPDDLPFFKVDLGAVKNVDLIHVGQRFTFTGGNSQPILHDENTGKEAVNGIYKIHQNMRFTVEYNTDTDATPDDSTWFPIHPDLFNAEINFLGGSDSWLTVKDINVEARHLRVVINNPLFAKVSENKWENEAFRMVALWLSEFQVYSSGYVQDINTDEIPEVKFTDDPNDEYRCLCNLSGDSVDMYRPNLLTHAEGLGLKYRTLVLELDDVWEFLVKDEYPGVTPDDCDDVSVGYKYLVTKLDANSRENEWKVRIDPRPDVMIGSTVWSSRLNPNLSFLVHGMTMEVIGDSPPTQTLTLSDYEKFAGGDSADGC